MFYVLWFSHGHSNSCQLMFEANSASLLPFSKCKSHWEMRCHGVHGSHGGDVLVLPRRRARRRARQRARRRARRRAWWRAWRRKPRHNAGHDTSHCIMTAATTIECWSPQWPGCCYSTLMPGCRSYWTKNNFKNPTKPPSIFKSITTMNEIWFKFKNLLHLKIIK